MLKIGGNYMKKLLFSIFSLVLIFSLAPLKQENVSATELEQETEDINIEPLGIDGPGDGIPYCNQTFTSFNNDDSYVTIQTNTQSADRSIQWGFHIRSSAYSKYSPTTTVGIGTATVNGVMINSPYSNHTAAPDYNFHGSLKNYQIMLTGKSQPLKANDIVTLFFRAHSSNGANSSATSVDLKCRVS